MITIFDIFDPNVITGYIERDQWYEISKLFHSGGPYHIETSPLIRIANQWTGFYMIGTSVMKKLVENLLLF